jgi:hypothetical protein
MIREIVDEKNNPAVTSDHWHVIHARWSGDPSGEPRFVRSIVSEHEDSAAALSAARAIKSSMAPSMRDRSRETRDQVFVRRPSSKSLKTARRVKRRRS